MKVVFASHNQGKILELKALLERFHIDLVSAKELNLNDVPETGLTFIENALIKARHASLLTGLPAIADDSGLEVFALLGQPGIYSARYAGEKATSAANIQKLLDKIQDFPEQQRQARFYCVLVFLSHAKDPTPLISEADWQGTLLYQPVNAGGFGYDPIFFDPIEKMTAAEMPLKRKNQLSHRGKALQLLLQKLPQKLGHEISCKPSPSKT